MRRVFFYMMLSVCMATAASAQQCITRKYDNVSISEALRQLNAEEAGFEINFLYNELEDFRITTSIDHQTVPDAIRQMIGFYPIRMTVDGTEIFVECPQKTSVRYRGNVIDDQGMPVAYANVALLSPQDSTLL
ncbi:MAG: TonB-dependent receptor, partial [Bacteroidaceae bacterium]|nr:TonB-dependent receptor [Bacteroidaceae bacterium]